MGDYQVSTTNVELELRSPTLVTLTKYAVTGLILKGSCKIRAGMVSLCSFDVVCVLLCSIGTLVAMHGHVTHAHAQLVM